jgi:hypothetical protein
MNIIPWARLIRSQCRSCWFTLLGIFPLDERIGRKLKHDEAMGFTQSQEKEGKKKSHNPKNMTNMGFWSKFSQLVFFCSKWLEICGFLVF